MPNSLNQKTYEALRAMDEMCDLLSKALPNSAHWSSIKASPNVPDVTPEQIIQARGSEQPIPSQVDAPHIPAESPELLSAPSDMSHYTPERLHDILSQALPHIAKVLSESLSAGAKR